MAIGSSEGVGERTTEKRLKLMVEFCAGAWQIFDRFFLIAVLVGENRKCVETSHAVVI